MSELACQSLTFQGCLSPHPHLLVVTVRLRWAITHHHTALMGRRQTHTPFSISYSVFSPFTMGSSSQLAVWIKSWADFCQVQHFFLIKEWKYSCLCFLPKRILKFQLAQESPRGLLNVEVAQVWPPYSADLELNPDMHIFNKLLRWLW